MKARTALPVTLTLLAGGLIGGTAAAAPPPAPPDGQSHTVTLITGDKVTVTDVPGGRHSVVVEPGAGRKDEVFFKQAVKNDLIVLPADIAPQVGSGQLDRALFDVTGLIEQGYDDSARNNIPVIITGTQFRGASVTKTLPSLHAFAATLPKGGLWTNQGGRIRLDRKVKASLDQSVPQIGAPQAWAAGFTGKGVKVAVIDTGYDQNHPDLKNAVVASKDFTGDGVQDGYGHGTHVASIVAGSGAASGGKYKGVAPDAQLLIGKALDNSGSGQDSTIIEAMQWASDAGAKVINLSLGSDGASDGTDPLSEAVDTLSREKNVLVVAAAGNEGTDLSIGSPGAADAALTVGSVTKQDALSDFSSRGPRIGDYAVKPDITAPGTGIVAARAKGTEAGDTDPVDDFYARLSGTSMATPHVAGAAAILAQEHPQWTEAQLKAVLTSSAKVNPGQSVFAQGAGRVDVAAAIKQTVTADTSVSFDRVAWPHDQAKPQTREVTYTNESDQPVELGLAFSSDAPSGVLSAPAGKLTVPAHGTAKEPITSNPKAMGANAGFFGGRLTATGGGNVVQTALGITSEQESYNLTVKLVDRTGKPQLDDLGHVLNIIGDQGGPDESSLDTVGGQVTVRVPKDTYRLNALISSPAGNDRIADVTMAAAPSLKLTQDTTLTLDARAGHKVSVKTPRKSAVNLYRDFGATIGDGQGSTIASTVYVEDNAVNLYAVPATGGTADNFVSSYNAQAVDSLDADRVVRGPMYNLAYGWPGKVPDRIDFTAQDRDLAKVHATFASKNGKADLVGRILNGYQPIQSFTSAAFTRVHLPGDRTEYYSTGDVFWINQLFRDPGTIDGNPPNPFGAVWATVTRYPAGAVEEPWNYAVEGPGFPGPASGKPIKGDSWWMGRDGDTLFTRIPLFADTGQYQHTFTDPDGTKGGWTLYRDGQQIGQGTDYTSFSQKVGPEAATYKLAGTADRAVPWSNLSTHVEGSWTFKSAHVNDDTTLLPLLAVKFLPCLDGYNRAPSAPVTAIPLRIERQVGSPVLPLTDLKVDASFDDGKTWQPAHVAGRQALVTNPASGKAFVSLRVHALDSGGNAVDQTVIRAYQLGGQ